MSKMADELEDDQWLYGDSTEASAKEAPPEIQNEGNSFAEDQTEDLPENALSNQVFRKLKTLIFIICSSAIFRMRNH